jgi:hypothetical protein
MIEFAKLAPETLLPRRECAAALSAVGYPIRAATLSTKATRGGGPPYYKFGRRVLYRWSDALAWAESKLSPCPLSSSDAAPRQSGGAP